MGPTLKTLIFIFIYTNICKEPNIKIENHEFRNPSTKLFKNYKNNE